MSETKLPDIVERVRPYLAHPIYDTPMIPLHRDTVEDLLDEITRLRSALAPPGRPRGEVMKCVICKRSDIALLRINAKDAPGLWACRKHLKQTDATEEKS